MLSFCESLIEKEVFNEFIEVIKLNLRYFIMEMTTGLAANGCLKKARKAILWR